MNRQNGLLHAAICLALLLAVGCSGPGSSARREALPPPIGLAEDEARAEFELMCRRVTESDEQYYGQRLLLESRKKLEAGLDDPAEEISVRKVLGLELIEQGRASDGLEVLEEALRMGRKHGISPLLQVELTSYVALAHMRAAEDNNCLLHHTAASCIVPFTEEAIHSKPEHARRAGDRFIDMLKVLQPRAPRTYHVAWLLNLMRMVTGDYPDGVPPAFRLPPGALASGAAFPRWRDRAPELGVNVIDLAGGAVMDDFDGDGLLDLVTSTWDPCGHLEAFRNDGAGGFDNVTEAWGLDSQFGGLNLVHADYDNDGRLDLLVLRGGWLHRHGKMRNSLLRNELGEGRDRFVDVSLSAGIVGTEYPGQIAAWADYDGDGDLDLYLAYESPKYDSYPAQLFQNNGDGTFTDVASRAGVTNLGYAKGVGWGDYDEDGDPDLYVSNVGPNRLYRNNGDGTFADVAPALGVVEPSGRSFGTWFFDFDNDGDLDLLVADFHTPPALVVASYFGVTSTRGQPLLYRNDGGRFVEVSREVGLLRPVLPMGLNFGDLDNDGWLDFYLGTGDPNYETVTPNLMYRNVGGKKFDDVTFAGGFGHIQKGHGVAFGDLDNDGDQDLFHQVGGFYPGDAYSNVLFENPGNGNAWVVLRLEGRRANRFGVGARIEVRIDEAPSAAGAADGGARSVHVVAGSGGSFGGSSMQQEIGLGRARSIEWINVRWPGSGTVQRLNGVQPNRVYRVIEGVDRLETVELPPIGLGS